MKHRSIFIAAAAMVGFAVAAAIVYAGPQGGMGSKGKEKKADTTSLMNKPAPKFSMQSMDGGQTVSLDDLKGNVVVLDFWASWCGPCKASLPHIQELSKNTELAGKGLKVYTVNCTTWKPETPDAAKQFVTTNNYTFNVLMDATGQVAKDYLVSGIPTTVIIGRDGAVKKAMIGFSDDTPKQLDKAIDMALQAKSPSARGPSTKPSQG